jgi:hypothetical protein
MATQMGARMTFESAKALVKGLGYSVEQAVLTQSYIRSEVAMSTSIANYHIPILVNDTQNGAVRVNEKRLNLQDIFIATEIAVVFGIGAGTTTSSPLYTYPNSTAFATGGTALWTIYNGYLNLSVNNQTVLPAWDVLRHYYAPQTQQNTNFNSATATAPGVYTQDQLDLSESPFFPVEPNIVLNGAANIQMSLSANGAPSAIATNSFICVLTRGILCQNVTTVK